MIAQLLVLLLFRSQEKFFRGIDISIATKLDNQAAEAILQHGFTQLPIPARITKAVQIVSFQSRVSSERLQQTMNEQTAEAAPIKKTQQVRFIYLSRFFSLLSFKGLHLTSQA